MPRKPKPPELIGGPYRVPPCDVGSRLVCKRKGPVKVAGLSDAPQPWPVAAGVGGRRPSLVLCGDLVRAVQTESGVAVAYWWGVDRSLVRRWRKALGVGRMTQGTGQLWRELATKRLTKASRVKGGKTSGAQRRAAKAEKGNQ